MLRWWSAVWWPWPLPIIPAGEAGDGFAEGVFLLPKQSADDIQSGAVVYLKDGVCCSWLQTVRWQRGLAWENAPANKRHCGGKNQCLICLRECVCRMDVATVRVMGKQAEINGVVYGRDAGGRSRAEMGAGFRAAQLSLVVFFSPVPSGPS